MALTKTAQDMLKLGSGGTYSLSRDALRHNLFDTWLLPAATADHTYFTQPIGSAWGAGIKTLNETNLTDTGRLPQGQTFLATAIKIACIANPVAAGINGATLAQSYINILHNSVFEIKVPGREYEFQTPGSAFLPAMTIATISNASVQQHGMGTMLASGKIKLDPTPVFLDNLVGFSVVQRCGNPIAATVVNLSAGFTILQALNATLQVTLEGFLTRSK